VPPHTVRQLPIKPPLAHTRLTWPAFDLLEFDGEDFRPLPLSERKARLARLLARKHTGVVLNEHTDKDGAVVFRHACKMGLEGIISKTPDRALSIGAVSGLAQGEEPG
jgi:ATP-dependent DNA ligase